MAGELLESDVAVLELLAELPGCAPVFCSLRPPTSARRPWRAAKP